MAGITCFIRTLRGPKAHYAVMSPAASATDRSTLAPAGNPRASGKWIAPPQLYHRRRGQDWSSIMRATCQAADQAQADIILG